MWDTGNATLECKPCDEGKGMFGELAVGYLFLGGAGAGSIAIASALDLACVRTPFGERARVCVDEAAPAERAVSFGMLVGLACLLLGIVCLLLDLGRVDRALSLFFSPSLTYLTLGSYALVLLAALGALLVAVRFAFFPGISRRVVSVAEAFAVLAGFAVMLYAGLLLQGVGGVAFWRSPFLPVLFVFSALSCGFAIVLLAAVLAGLEKPPVRLVRMLVRADAAVIVLEVLTAALLMGTAQADAHPAVVQSLARLVEGDLAARWWVGFVACGMVVPFALEAMFSVSRQPSLAWSAVAVAAVLVLVGGFCMRGAVVEAGSHRDLVLEKPDAQALRLE